MIVEVIPRRIDVILMARCGCNKISPYIRPPLGFIAPMNCLVYYLAPPLALRAVCRGRTTSPGFIAIIRLRSIGEPGGRNGVDDEEGEPMATEGGVGVGSGSKRGGSRGMENRTPEEVGVAAADCLGAEGCGRGVGGAGVGGADGPDVEAAGRTEGVWPGAEAVRRAGGGGGAGGAPEESFFFSFGVRTRFRASRFPMITRASPICESEPRILT